MVYAAGDQNSLMEESTQAASRREEMIKMYHACKDALQLVQDVNLKTGTVDWFCWCRKCTFLCVHCVCVHVNFDSCSKKFNNKNIVAQLYNLILVSIQWIISITYYTQN